MDDLFYKFNSAIKFFLLVIFFHVLSLCNFVKVYAATPSITSLTVNGSTIGRFQKFEATFQITKTYPAMDYSQNKPAIESFYPYYYYDAADPVGINGITFDGHFIAPSGKESVVPAFYHQQYSGTGTSLTASNAYSWKLRFAPQETGNYKYYITIQDKEGNTRYPVIGYLNFTSTTSTSKGFVRVSNIDSRFMKFDNGESFVPLGEGHQWWKAGNGRSADYETAFNNYGANGINFTRIWDQNDGYALTVEGHFDQYPNLTDWRENYNPADSFRDTGNQKYNPANFTKGTQMNQRGNYEEDRIIEAAERNGVYIQICSHSDTYWIWPDGLSEAGRLSHWKRNYRYRIARWGYSTSVFAWEIWNEEGHILSGTPEWNFYKNLGTFIKATDPYSHLYTTSQGSQSYSPGFWSSSEIGFDLANYHDYMMISRYPASLTNDEVNFVQSFAWCLGTKGQYCSGLGVGDTSSWNGAFKPWVWGELDVGTSNWNEPNPAILNKGPRVKMLHNTTWAGLFSPTGVSPLDWYWDSNNLESGTLEASYADRKAARAFFNGIDYAGANFTFMMSAGDKPSGYSGETLTLSNQTARAYGMRRQDKTAAYIWVQNRNNVWPQGTPAAISTDVTIGGLNSGGNYSVEIWRTDTTANQIISTTIKTAASGNITVSLSNLSTDQAVKIISAQGIPSPTPYPSPSTSPSFTIADLKTLFTRWLTNQDSGYYPKEGKVNALDASYIIKWLMP